MKGQPWPSLTCPPLGAGSPLLTCRQHARPLRVSLAAASSVEPWGEAAPGCLADTPYPPHSPSAPVSALPFTHICLPPRTVSIFRGVTMSSDSDSVGSGPQGVDGRAGPRLCALGLFPEGVNLIIVSHPRVGRGDLGGGPLEGGKGRFPS